MVDIVNEFGKAGGFDLLIKRLSNRKPNMPVKNMRFILSAISKTVKILTRKTYQTYVPQLQKLVWETLQNLSDVELRDLKKV